jgi:hypothetical protein
MTAATGGIFGAGAVTAITGAASADDVAGTMTAAAGGTAEMGVVTANTGAAAAADGASAAAIGSSAIPIIGTDMSKVNPAMNFNMFKLLK